MAEVDEGDEVAPQANVPGPGPWRPGTGDGGDDGGDDGGEEGGDPDPPGRTDPPVNPHDDLEKELRAQQQELDAEEAHLATVTDPAVRAEIQARIDAHKRQIAHIEAELGN